VTDTVRLLKLARPVGWRLAAATALGSATALAGIGLMATSAYLISRASQQPPILTLAVAIVAVRFFGISRGVFRYLDRLTGHDAAFRVLTDIRVAVYRRLERLAPSGLPAFRSGDLLSRLVADVDELQELYLRVLPPFAVFALAGTVVVAFLGWLLPSVGLVVLIGLLVGGLVVPAVTTAVARRADQHLAHDRGELTAAVVDLVQAAPELVVAGTGPQRLAALDAVADRLRRRETRVAGAAGLGAGLTLLTTGLTAAASLWLGAGAVDSGSLDGVLLAVVVLTPLAAFELVSPLPAAAQQLRSVQSAARRVLEVLDSPPPVPDPAEAAPVPPGAPSLELVGVAARWPGAVTDAVAAVDAVFAAGSRSAIVGPSGSGKSTLAALLLRFLDATEGSVRMSGRDVRELAADEVRRKVGLLSQEAHVFDTSIEENLRLARRDASTGELVEALTAAGLVRWVDSLPDGLRTPVGQHGSRLSGGQRQRLSLARALLADFPFLVLDEPGEHLDTGTADALLADLLRVTRGRTVVVVSHRLAGLTDLDQILVMSDGAVADRGRHDDLLTRNEWYARQWARETELDLLMGGQRLRTLDG
jgi:thiol reductant ABC exporter CydC subunit